MVNVGDLQLRQHLPRALVVAGVTYYSLQAELDSLRHNTKSTDSHVTTHSGAWESRSKLERQNNGHGRANVQGSGKAGAQ